MATTLSATFELKGQGSYANGLDLSSPTDRPVIGSGNFDAITYSVTNGTGSSQADLWWHDERTLANGATDSLDLAGGLTDPWGGTLTSMVEVRMILIVIDAPDGTKALRVGPRSVANAWVGPFGDASDFINVEEFLWLASNRDGGLGTVTAGTGDLLIVNNNSGVSVTYRAWIIGVSA